MDKETNLTISDEIKAAEQRVDDAVQRRETAEKEVDRKATRPNKELLRQAEVDEGRAIQERGIARESERSEMSVAWNEFIKLPIAANKDRRKLDELFEAYWAGVGAHKEPSSPVMDVLHGQAERIDKQIDEVKAELMRNKEGFESATSTRLLKLTQEEKNEILSSISPCDVSILDDAKFKDPVRSGGITAKLRGHTITYNCGHNTCHLIIDDVRESWDIDYPSDENWGLGFYTHARDLAGVLFTAWKVLQLSRELKVEGENIPPAVERPMQKPARAIKDVGDMAEFLGIPTL